MENCPGTKKKKVGDDALHHGRYNVIDLSAAVFVCRRIRAVVFVSVAALAIEKMRTQVGEKFAYKNSEMRTNEKK